MRNWVDKLTKEGKRGERKKGLKGKEGGKKLSNPLSNTVKFPSQRVKDF